MISVGTSASKGRIPNFLRLEHQKVPIYLNAELPDWCIPNKRSDTILHCLVKGGSLWEAAQLDCRSYGGSVSESLFQIETLLKRFEEARGKPYRGRSAYHTLTQLRECWFHLTNRCNLNCTHCMFCSSPREPQGLSKKDVFSAVNETYSLGCRIFYFTGGEPFAYEDFTSLCDELLTYRDTHLVILTNGLFIPLHRSWLPKVERDRVHFQVSVDGVKKHHDALRGKGAFDKVVASLKLLQEMKCHTSLAMSVLRENVTDMHRIVEMAASLGIGYVHYLWFFQKGKGSHKKSPPIPTIVRELLRAHRKAERYGIRIDNVEIIKSQVFSLPGTRFDLSNAGWESIAVDPEGKLYPSPALVGEKKLMAGHISEGIEKVWRKSPVLTRVRNASLIDHIRYRENPLRFLIGGGDIDHSFIRAGTLTGHDPYLELYNQILLALLSEEGKRPHSHHTVSLLSRMGERVYECGEGWGESVFTHSNCVLSLPGKDAHSLVQSFYSAVANVPAQEIANPVHYDEQEIVHIPEESRIRSYGCGSPVLDCELKPGETLVDLGCGAGVECFIAAKKVGPEGRVIGIDMADAMLALAEKSKQRVTAHLAYDTIEFKKAYLEQLPLMSNTVDVVISNCVINLSPDKRTTFAEISRILKPGGRMVISDIVYDEDIPLAIKYNEKLRGECIGGAFKESELFALLGDLNFEAATVKKRVFYREVKGHRFYSITYTAMKPQGAARKELIYRGPFAALITDEGTVLRRGVKTGVALSAGFHLDESVFAVTRKGEVENVAQEVTCECSARSTHLTRKSPRVKNPAGR